MAIRVDAESLSSSFPAWRTHVFDIFSLNLLSLYTLIYRGIITKCAAKWPHNNVGGPLRAANCHIYQTDIHAWYTYRVLVNDVWEPSSMTKTYVFILKWPALSISKEIPDLEIYKDYLKITVHVKTYWCCLKKQKKNIYIKKLIILRHII